MVDVESLCGFECDGGVDLNFLVMDGERLVWRRKGSFSRRVVLPSPIAAGSLAGLDFSVAVSPAQANLIVVRLGASFCVVVSGGIDVGGSILATALAEVLGFCVPQAKLMQRFLTSASTAGSGFGKASVAGT